MQVSDFSALRYDSKCVRPRKLLGSWIKVSSWVQKRSLWAGGKAPEPGSSWGAGVYVGWGVHFKVCFRFTKNMDQKQNSLVTLQRHLHRRTPQRSRYMLPHKKGTHTLKTMLGTEHVGMWYVLCPETQVSTHMQGTDISSWALSITSAADAQGPVSPSVPLGSSRGCS